MNMSAFELTLTDSSVPFTQLLDQLFLLDTQLFDFIEECFHGSSLTTCMLLTFLEMTPS